MRNELLILKIRNLIAAREFNTAEANRELHCCNGWLIDHEKIDRDLAKDINELIKKIEESFKRE